MLAKVNLLSVPCRRGSIAIASNLSTSRAAKAQNFASQKRQAIAFTLGHEEGLKRANGFTRVECLKGELRRREGSGDNDDHGWPEAYWVAAHGRLFCWPDKATFEAAHLSCAATAEDMSSSAQSTWRLHKARVSVDGATSGEAFDFSVGVNSDAVPASDHEVIHLRAPCAAAGAKWVGKLIGMIASHTQ